MAGIRLALGLLTVALVAAAVVTGIETWQARARHQALTDSGLWTARAVDLGQQENAVNLTWSGAGPARFVLRHAPLDLTRDANAACCLALHCVVKRPPERPLKPGTPRFRNWRPTRATAVEGPTVPA